MSYGIIVTLPGYDVKDATPEQCAVHSDYANPKIKSGQTPPHFNTIDYTFASDPPNGTLTIATIPHGYSYVPAAITYVKDFFPPTPRFYVLPLFQRIGGPGQNQYLRSYTDSTNLYIQYVVDNNGDISHLPLTGFHYTFKYYLFVENG